MEDVEKHQKYFNHRYTKVICNPFLIRQTFAVLSISNSKVCELRFWINYHGVWMSSDKIKKIHSHNAS